MIEAAAVEILDTNIVRNGLLITIKRASIRYRIAIRRRECIKWIKRHINKLSEQGQKPQLA